MDRLKGENEVLFLIRVVTYSKLSQEQRTVFQALEMCLHESFQPNSQRVLESHSEDTCFQTVLNCSL